MIAADHLIVFTRYPEPGRTKTRLIPALGAEAAATLQRQLTEHMLAQVQGLQQQRAISVEVQFAGGSTEHMQAWLGTTWHYQAQHQGDLGMRMAQAFQLAFARGATRVVIIGIDCPSLNQEGLTQAFAALNQQDLVLGPATDGGYYLIGLRRFIPELFINIEWSTAAVLTQTVAIAQQQNLAIAYLPPLSDIDRPDDLAIWHTIKAEKISVIIPVLNESAHIHEVIATAQSGKNIEIIVVDGGSGDQTGDIAQALGARVIHTQAGRAWQMNAGAAAATGDILLFLHADTRLPANFSELVRQTLQIPGTVAGAFDLTIDGDAVGLPLVEWGVKWRSHFCQFPYGDQALFLKSAQFQQVGGFPELPIMEDFELVRRLKALGRIRMAAGAVITSGRRWQQLGVLRTTVLNQIIVAAYFLGVSPYLIALWYRGKGHKS